MGQNLPSTDPYRNSTQLDIIPANLLDNIVTAKTFTPDQPGNFTGGNVNITTKSFLINSHLVYLFQLDSMTRVHSRVTSLA